MSEILIDCCPGISGDMLLGAFYDLGVPKNIIEKNLAEFGLEKFYSFLDLLYSLCLQSNLGDELK